MLHLTKETNRDKITKLNYTYNWKFIPTTDCFSGQTGVENSIAISRVDTVYS